MHILQCIYNTCMDSMAPPLFPHPTLTPPVLSLSAKSSLSFFLPLVSRHSLLSFNPPPPPPIFPQAPSNPVASGTEYGTNRRRGKATQGKGEEGEQMAWRGGQSAGRGIGGRREGGGYSEGWGWRRVRIRGGYGIGMIGMGGDGMLRWPTRFRPL